MASPAAGPDAVDPSDPAGVLRLAPAEPDRARLTGAVRRVNDVVVGVRAPADVLARAAAHLAQAAALLEPHAVSADDLPGWAELGTGAGNRVLGPARTGERVDRDSYRATVTFSSFYLGANGAVHGGAVTLLFDEVLGRLASEDRPWCRTAYLKVDFRRVTPVGRPLRIEARFEREEGRKRFLHGGLYDGEDLTAEATGLWVELREGAP